MALGPGKYDDLCTYVREEAEADGAIVIVLGGKKGTGFSVQAGLVTHLTLPDTLRDVANSIEHEIQRMLASTRTDGGQG